MVKYKTLLQNRWIRMFFGVAVGPAAAYGILALWVLELKCSFANLPSEAWLSAVIFCGVVALAIATAPIEKLRDFLLRFL